MNRIEAAIHELIAAFAEANGFENNICALDNVTPADWRAQLGIAKDDLENGLEDLLGGIEAALHDGGYASYVKK